MKKLLTRLACVAVLMFLACVVFAGSVYDRAKITLPTSGGAATWTNTVQDANIELVRIGTPGWYAVDTVTVTRVTGDTTSPQTNTLVVIVTATTGAASNIVDQSVSMPRYMKAGDKLTFSAGSATGGVFYIEYLNQRH